MATDPAPRMPVVLAGAALLALMACGSAPKAPPAPASAADSPAATPAAASVPPAPAAESTPPAADSAPRPVNSPDSSVRRWKLDEVVTGRAPLADECEGDACREVSVTWLEPGDRFENLGRRDVAITIWFALKGDCIRARFSLEPTKTSGWGNTGFCKPYRADYP